MLVCYGCALLLRVEHRKGALHIAASRENEPPWPITTIDSESLNHLLTLRWRTVAALRHNNGGHGGAYYMALSPHLSLPLS